MCFVKFLPMECHSYPATRIFYDKGDPNPNMLVIQKYTYFIFKIYVHYLEWDQTRIIWIAFYKNQDNKNVSLQNYPKILSNNCFYIYLLSKNLAKMNLKMTIFALSEKFIY